MVLSTENDHDTTSVSVVLLLTTPISGLTVKISRFSQNPSIAVISYIFQHLFKANYFQTENITIPHKTYIVHIPDLVCIVCFYSKYFIFYFVKHILLQYFTCICNQWGWATSSHNISYCTSLSILQSDNFNCIIFVQSSASVLLFFSVYTKLGA